MPFYEKAPIGHECVILKGSGAMPKPPTIPDLELFPLFRGLPPSLLETWKPSFSKKRFSKRERLIFPSSRPNVIFFIFSGKVKISYYSEDGKEFTVAILAAGEVYSEHSLALATAVEETEVIYLSMADFGLMMDESPELARRLVRVLGQILRLTNDLIVDLAFREVASRLARVFWRTLQSQRLDPTVVEPYTLYLTHEELASLSGTTRQTVNEILRHWEQQGILALHRGHVILLNPDRLWEKLDR